MSEPLVTADRRAAPQSLPTDPITDMSAVNLSHAIAHREVSCREVMTAYLRRIEIINPAFTAIVSMRPPERLLEEADEADLHLQQNGPRGPLHGFPLAPKDAVATAGLVTTNGFQFVHEVPKADGILAERMRRAGGIFIGKTNMPEAGLGSQTYNNVFGTTLNAWNPRLTAGGSSGGAAVAIAQRLVPLADGSDMMGSLRNPAGWNNIASLRPSAGRVPCWPTNDVLQFLATEGPMGRTVADTALLLSVQAGHDKRSPLSLPDDPSHFANGLEKDLKGRRVGWLKDLGGHLPTETGVLDLCDQAVKHFETIGCEVDVPSLEFDLERLWDCWITLRSHTIAPATAPLYRDARTKAQLKPELVWEIETGLALTSEQIGEAIAVRSAWYGVISSLLAQYDFLILPTAQVFPFDAHLHWPKQIGSREMDTYHRWMEVAAVGALTGLPIAAVPAGFASERRAMGLQIISRAQADLPVLQIAHSYELASGFSRHRPDTDCTAPQLPR